MASLARKHDGRREIADYGNSKDGGRGIERVYELDVFAANEVRHPASADNRLGGAVRIDGEMYDGDFGSAEDFGTRGVGAEGGNVGFKPGLVKSERGFDELAFATSGLQFAGHEEHGVFGFHTKFCFVVCQFEAH